MSDALAPSSLDEAQIQLGLLSHELMLGYTNDRLSHPFEEDASTTRTIQEYLGLLQNAAATANDPGPLMDASLLVKCFAATCLLPADHSLQIPLFLDWVNTVVEDILRWPQDLRKLVEANDGKAKQPLFWRFILQSVLSGKLADAAAALRNSEAFTIEPSLTDFVELLETYPLEAKKYAEFMFWRSSAVALDANLKASPPDNPDYRRHAYMLISVLTGDIAIINRLSTSWILSTTALYLFRDPSPDMLSDHFATATSAHPVSGIATWEDGCKALFQSKVVSALGSLHLLDLGSAVVLSEFCSERGLLQKYASTSGKPGGGVKEELALQYAKQCLSETSLVPIGLDLLVNIGSPGAKTLAESLLPQLLQRSPHFADLAIETAEQLNLSSTVPRLSEIAARAEIQNDRYVFGIQHYDRAGNIQKVTETSWALFKSMIVNRSPVGDDITLDILRQADGVDKLDLSTTVKDSLAPAAVLLALLDAVNTEDVTAISANLSGLLTFPDPPLEFYPLLVALVSGISGTVITRKNMVMLMDALNAWDKAPPTTKEKGYNLLTEAAENPAWHPPLQPDYNKPTELVWLLRRQLAKEIVL